MALLEGPRVDRVAGANELEQAWLAKLAGGPLVDALDPRQEHGVVEQPAETMLVGEVDLDVQVERVAVGQYPAE